jgi:hypothetical protein
MVGIGGERDFTPFDGLRCALHTQKRRAIASLLRHGWQGRQCQGAKNHPNYEVGQQFHVELVIKK